MKRYLLRLIPEQPLRLDDATMIPAQAVRGAIADVLLAGCVPGHEHDTGPCGAECRYWSVFGEGVRLKVGPAYAGSGDDTAPTLATVRTCSRVPGFKTAGAHGVFDIAVRQWVFEQASVTPDRLLAPFSLRCPVCDAPLMPYRSVITRQGEREFAAVGDVSTSLTSTHASISRTRGQVIERHEITGVMINRGIYYTAQLTMPDHLEVSVRQALGGGLWIGGKRSQGFGAVRTELVPTVANALPLGERIARFNRAIRAEQRFYAAMDSTHQSIDEGESYFSLDLSAAALPAYAESPSIVPVLTMLSSVAPVRHWIDGHVGGGWHAGAGLPRRTQIGATGVVLYRVSPDAKRTAVDEMLAFLEAEGIGTGRERGYGAVTVCDPFHLFMDPI